MGLDVRLPVGVMFGIMGALLVGYGVLGDQSIYARSLGININTIWGGVMIVFAAVLLLLASRRRRAAAVEELR
jgi:high-affinity Fe2+/Pb2+ permease